MRRKRPNRLIPLLLVLADALVILYPVVAMRYNNVRQHEFAQKCNSSVSEIDTSERDAELRRAREYNSTLSGVPILDPYLGEVEHPESEAYAAYLSQLDETEIMARVRIPYWSTLLEDLLGRFLRGDAPVHLVRCWGPPRAHPWVRDLSAEFDHRLRELRETRPGFHVLDIEIPRPTFPPHPLNRGISRTPDAFVPARLEGGTA